MIFFKNKKTKWRYANISDTPFDQRSLILREAWFLGCDGQRDRQTERQTERHTDIATYRLNRPKGRFSEKSSVITVYYYCTTTGLLLHLCTTTVLLLNCCCTTEILHHCTPRIPNCKLHPLQSTLQVYPAVIDRLALLHIIRSEYHGGCF